MCCYHKDTVTAHNGKQTEAKILHAFQSPIWIHLTIHSYFHTFIHPSIHPAIYSCIGSYKSKQIIAFSLKPQDNFDIIFLNATLRERLNGVQYLRGWWRRESLPVAGRTEVGSEVCATPVPHWRGHKEGGAELTLQRHSREGEHLTDKSRERG